MIHPRFQEVNRSFALSFENNAHRTSYRRYHLPTVEIKYCNFMIDGTNFFDQPVKNVRTYQNIRIIATHQGDDIATGYLLDHPYFKENCKLIAIYLSKQHALDADSKVIQQINFTRNLDQAGNTTMFFNIQEVKESTSDFSQRIVRVL